MDELSAQDFLWNYETKHCKPLMCVVRRRDDDDAVEPMESEEAKAEAGHGHGFGQRYAALPRLDKGRALAFGVPDDTWAPGAGRAVWARGVRAVVQFGVESSVMCPVLGQAMWRMGR